MITINRETGKVVKADTFAKAQNQKAWEMILNNYTTRHPEMLGKDGVNVKSNGNR